MQQYKNSWEKCFLCGLCRGYTRNRLCFVSEFGSCKPVNLARELQWDRRGPVKVWRQKLRNLRPWKRLPHDWWRHSRLRRLSTCCSELQSVYICESTIVTEIFSKCSCCEDTWIFTAITYTPRSPWKTPVYSVLEFRQRKVGIKIKQKWNAQYKK
jgi:hypothetical protein